MLATWSKISPHCSSVDEPPFCSGLFCSCVSLQNSAHWKARLFLSTRKVKSVEELYYIPLSGGIVHHKDLLWAANGMNFGKTWPKQNGMLPLAFVTWTFQSGDATHACICTAEYESVGSTHRHKYGTNLSWGLFQNPHFETPSEPSLIWSSVAPSARWWYKWRTTGGRGRSRVCSAAADKKKIPAPIHSWATAHGGQRRPGAHGPSVGNTLGP